MCGQSFPDGENRTLLRHPLSAIPLASVITGTIFWMVAHCKAFCSPLTNPRLCLKEPQAEELGKESNF